MQKVKNLLLGLALVPFFGFALDGYAQNTLLPVVTVTATTPYASWSGDPGVFTFLREGSTNQTLNVFYLVSGTATNGADYDMIGNWVTIPAGVTSNTVTVTPINNGQTNIETVEVKLSPSPTGLAQNYKIGYPASATVYIAPAGVTNIPPNVALFSPTNGAVFNSPGNVPLAAFGGDPDGYVTSVEFFAGTNSLGVVSNGVIVDPPFPPGAFAGSRAFFLTWSNPVPGNYVLTAKATDNGGASTLSEPVSITVLQGPLPTNQPPVVKIITPDSGESYFSPVDIGICASAYDPDGYVSTVEFFAGTNSLGIKTNNPVSVGPMNPFCLVWSNVPPGSYTLTAVATDNGGASTTSGPVMIFVSNGPPPPPPTNFPPLVRITSPPNGAVLRAPLDLPIFAFATERGAAIGHGGSISSVEFFADTNSLGLGHTLCVLPPGGPWQTFVCPSNFFNLTWSNPSPGAYVLTAVATDETGAVATSGPVKITILGPPPPPTNRPAIVSIGAPDPLAIEGTNCWPWLGLANPTPTWTEWNGPSGIWHFFTNCGPKDATFSVRRYGDTNEDLVVTYDIGGTATNGVDYVPLSGSVTIPAGQRHAEISIVPLDDGTPDISSTVVLKLTSSTNYVLGYPRDAAVLILDGPGSRLGNGLLPGGSFHVQASGPDGAWFHVEFSTNLMDWTAICTNQVVNGSIDFVDPDAPSDNSRFYRTVPETNPPPY